MVGAEFGYPVKGLRGAESLPFREMASETRVGEERSGSSRTEELEAEEAPERQSSLQPHEDEGFEGTGASDASYNAMFSV